MPSLVSATSSSTIKWQALSSLLCLDIAIILSWIAYHEYQPKLLHQFQFDNWVIFLKIVQGIILFITPPLAGWLADNIRRTRGDRLPMINVGISVVSMVFMVVAFTIWSNPSGIMRFFFPVMIVLWLVSMNIFHSPAISMVEMFAPADKMPQVMAFFAAITGIAEAVEPSIVDIIEYFGAPLTFAIGGVLVLLAGWWLQSMIAQLAVQPEDMAARSAQKSHFLAVLGLGLGMGLATMVFFKLFPSIYFANAWQAAGWGLSATFTTSLLIALAALLSFPVSMLMKAQQLWRFLTWSIAVASTLTVLLLSNSLPPLNTYWFLAFPVFFAAISVTALPLALSQLCENHKVLGIGLFFSMVELPNSLAELLL